MESGIQNASAGDVICVAQGSYTSPSLSGTHSGDVTLRPADGAAVTLTGDLSIDGSHIVLHGFTIVGEVDLAPGADSLTVDHNDISGGYFGVNGGGVDCSAPNAPVYNGCTTVPPLTNVVVSGNRIHGYGAGSSVNSEDALHFNHFQNLRITANELFATEENGNHSDCLQTVWGGSALTFDHNYEHDNQCQGFFLKDGDVTDVTVYDNLFVRDRVLSLDENNIQIFDSYNVVIENNTNWSGNGDILRAPDGTSYNATFDHNVSPVFNNGCCSETTFTLTESHNLFGQAPWTFTPDATDTVNASPTFMDPATDDYRLATNPDGIGVDWRPADYHYGP